MRSKRSCGRCEGVGNVAEWTGIQQLVTSLVCAPNISGSGRRRRRNVGYAAAAFASILTAAFVVTHVAWYVRIVVFLPAAMAAVGFFQASRNTCLAHASKGTIEQEDFSTTKASEEQVSASRLVAAGIRRDSLLIGVAAAMVAVATALFS
jgi:hypothetical protein